MQILHFSLANYLQKRMSPYTCPQLKIIKRTASGNINHLRLRPEACPRDPVVWNAFLDPANKSRGVGRAICGQKQSLCVSADLKLRTRPKHGEMG